MIILDAVQRKLDQSAQTNKQMKQELKAFQTEIALKMDENRALKQELDSMAGRGTIIILRKQTSQNATRKNLQKIVCRIERRRENVVFSLLETMCYFSVGRFAGQVLRSRLKKLKLQENEIP